MLHIILKYVIIEKEREVIMQLREIIKRLDGYCPFEWQENFDNSGFQFGSPYQEINRALLVLDITEEAVEEAINKKTDLIISHHPFFFSNIKSIDIDSYKGRIIKKLFDNNISVVSIHTNLDMHQAGVSFNLAKELEIKNPRILFEMGEGYGYGMKGEIDEISFKEFREQLIERLDLPHIRYFYGDDDIMIKNIGVMGGSGGSFIYRASKSSIDLFLTGDLDYHDGQRAKEHNLPVIDIGHYHSEKYWYRNLKEYIVAFIPIVEEFIIPFTKKSY